MSQSLFRGSGVALVTPMTPDGIDFPALEQLIEWHIASSTDALILCATTGEGATLTYAERAEIIERSIRQVNGRVPVIVGTGSNNTASAIALSREACAAGADGVLVVTPYYNKATQRGLVRHFTAVADAVDRPLIVYNVPIPHRRELHRRDLRCARAAPEHRRRQGGLRQLRPDPGDP